MVSRQPKIPPITEAVITRQIRQYLKIAGILHWKQHQGLGSTPGIPDIIGCLPDGRMLAIEVKRPNGKLSPHQVKWTRWLTDNGAMVIIARDLADVINAIEANGQIKQRGLF